MAKRKKSRIKKVKEKANLEKLQKVLEYFQSDIEDVHFISKATQFSIQTVRRYLKNYRGGKDFLQETRGRTKN